MSASSGGCETCVHDDGVRPRSHTDGCESTWVRARCTRASMLVVEGRASFAEHSQIRWKVDSGRPPSQ
eukprot:8557954-Pyramimonas_sp.AAC.1